MLLIISLKVLASLSISCKDMKGDDVDWFSVIKAPESSSPNNGEDFMYLDASNLSPSISNILINQPGAISYTLDQINSKTVSSVAFNDEPGVVSVENHLKKRLKISGEYAHAKGIIAYEGNTAFYVVHSFPLYPGFTSSGQVNTTIPTNELVYGQNMMCISLPTSTLFELVGVMALIQPDVYHEYIVVENSNITALVNDVIIGTSSYGAYTFNLKGITWTYLAKTQYSLLDLWDSVVAGYYKQGFNVQSWGKPYMTSVCPPNSKYPVLNVASLKIGTISWKGTQDHSKWGIPNTDKVVCYGDMNRMTSQEKRGGGALCISESTLYTIHQNIITGVNPCNTI